MNSKKISFITIYMLALAVILLGYYYLIFLNLDQKVMVLDEERAGYQEEYSMLVDNLSKVDALQNRIEQDTALKNEISAKLVDGTGLDIADQVYRAMAATGLNETNVASVSVSDGQPTAKVLSDGKTIFSASISLNIHADYPTVQRFLKQFEEAKNSAFYAPAVMMSKADNGENYGVTITYYYAQLINESVENTTEADSGAGSNVNPEANILTPEEEAALAKARG